MHKRFLFLIFVLLLAISACSPPRNGSSYVDPASTELDTPSPEIDIPDNPENPCGSMTGAACDVFNDVNAQRVANGVTALKPLSKCINLAQAHVEDMVADHFFSHTSPTQGTFQERAQDFGIGGTSGENIAMGQSVATVVTSWMNSSGHRVNILNPAYKSSGLGYALDSSNKPYYVQCFASEAGD
jgi:uncharacterized protein YkwD